MREGRSRWQPEQKKKNEFDDEDFAVRFVR